MTALITIEEYNKDPGAFNAVILGILQPLRTATYDGANPTIRELRAQATKLQQISSSATPEVLVAETNTLISLLDRTLANDNSLNSDQRESFNNALAPINKSREAAPIKQQEKAEPPPPGYKEAPESITPEKWDANDKAIKDAAKEAIQVLNGVGPTEGEVQNAVAKVKEALAKDDTASLYLSMRRLEDTLKDASEGAAAKAKGIIANVSKPLVENQRSSNGKTMEPPPKAQEAPPKPQPSTGKLCEPITYERWGVRFRFLDKPPDKVGDCESKGDGQWDMKDWFLQLLPAMQSVIPRQGARDVPNAGPGLSFRFKNNMVKHKIPGGQPVYQMMGVDNAIITFVGTFTGDGGLGYINKVNIEDGELAESALRLLEEEAAARRAGVAFPRAKKYGGEYPYGSHPVNAMFNPIYHVRNRALAPGGDTSSALVGSNSTGWLIDNSILRSGFFERDGCPGQCPPPSWGGFPNGHIDEAGGKVAWGDFGVWPDGSQYGDIGTRSQMDTHKLAYIAAYLDAYHEMVSFYKFAVQAGKLMEITINLRKSHDGLKPRIADPRMKGKFKSDTPDPLRDMHTGNPTFKGYLRTMNTWAQYSDRVWYVMEFEVVDHGLQGKKAVNLTNKVAAGRGSEEKAGPNNGDSSEGSSSNTSNSSNNSSSSGSSEGSTTNSQGPAFKALSDKFPKEDVLLELKDGRVVTLYRNGVIKDKEGNYLSYSEAKDMLNFIDPFGHSTLNNWYDSVRVLAYPDGGLGLLNIDGSIVALSPDGKATLSSAVGKGDSGEVDLNKVNIDGINYSLNFKVDPTQRAAVDEWKAAHLSSDGATPSKAGAVPITSATPTVPNSKPPTPSPTLTVPPNTTIPPIRDVPPPGISTTAPLRQAVSVPLLGVAMPTSSGTINNSPEAWDVVRTLVTSTQEVTQTMANTMGTTVTALESWRDQVLTPERKTILNRLISDSNASITQGMANTMGVTTSTLGAWRDGMLGIMPNVAPELQPSLVPSRRLTLPPGITIPTPGTNITPPNISGASSTTLSGGSTFRPTVPPGVSVPAAGTSIPPPSISEASSTTLDSKLPPSNATQSNLPVLGNKIETTNVSGTINNTPGAWAVIRSIVTDNTATITQSMANTMGTTVKALEEWRDNIAASGRQDAMSSIISDSNAAITESLARDLNTTVDTLEAWRKAIIQNVPTTSATPQPQPGPRPSPTPTPSPAPTPSPVTVIRPTPIYLYPVLPTHPNYDPSYPLNYKPNPGEQGQAPDVQGPVPPTHPNYDPDPFWPLHYNPNLTLPKQAPIRRTAPGTNSDPAAPFVKPITDPSNHWFPK